MPGDELLEADLCLLQPLVTGPKYSQLSAQLQGRRHQGKTIGEGLARGGDVKWACRNLVGRGWLAQQGDGSHPMASWQPPHCFSSL